MGECEKDKCRKRSDSAVFRRRGDFLQVGECVKDECRKLSDPVEIHRCQKYVNAKMETPFSSSDDCIKSRSYGGFLSVNQTMARAKSAETISSVLKKEEVSKKDPKQTKFQNNVKVFYFDHDGKVQNNFTREMTTLKTHNCNAGILQKVNKTS